MCVFGKGLMVGYVYSCIRTLYKKGSIACISTARYDRLGVDRPGRYTVRLSLIFYHNDERRADGVKLNLSDLIEVHVGTWVPVENKHTSIKQLSVVSNDAMMSVSGPAAVCGLDGEVCGACEEDQSYLGGVDRSGGVPHCGNGWRNSVGN